MKVFVPFSESLIEELGLSLGDLVPFNIDYECLRAYETAQSGQAADQQRSQSNTGEPVQVPPAAAHSANIEQHRAVSA